MSIGYVEFETVEIGEAKMLENCEYLELPKPVVMGGQEVPELGYYTDMGPLFHHPTNGKCAKIVNTEEYFRPTWPDTILMWKPELFAGYTFYTEAQMYDKGYFSEEQ